MQVFRKDPAILGGKIEVPTRVADWLGSANGPGFTEEEVKAVFLRAPALFTKNPAKMQETLDWMRSDDYLEGEEHGLACVERALSSHLPAAFRSLFRSVFARNLSQVCQAQPDHPERVTPRPCPTTLRPGKEARRKSQPHLRLSEQQQTVGGAPRHLDGHADRI